MKILRESETDVLEAETLISIITDESKLGILLGLHYFKSLNLTQISTFTGKTKPTVYHHIKGLAEHNFIKLDQNSITKSGKYFQLTSLAKRILNLDTQSTSSLNKTKKEPIEELRQEKLLLSKVLKVFSLMTKNIAYFTSDYIERNIEKIIREETKSKKIYPLELVMTNLTLSNKAQEDRLTADLNRISQTILDISKENQKITGVENNEFPKEQFFYLFSVPVDKMSDMIFSD